MKKIILLIVGAISLSGCEAVNHTLESGLNTLKDINCANGIKTSCRNQQTVMQPSESATNSAAQTERSTLTSKSAPTRAVRNHSTTRKTVKRKSTVNSESVSSSAKTSSGATGNDTSATVTNTTPTPTKAVETPKKAPTVDVSKELNALQ